MAFFSVIIPTFNREKLLPRALYSLLQQTFSDWECLIIDDGSSDRSKELVKEFSANDHRIKYFFQENAGRSAARNKGIELATGKYIGFLDSDDYFLDNHLEIFKNSIEQNFSKLAFFINGMIIEREGVKKNILIKKKNQSSLLFFLENTIHSQQVCGHRSIFEKEKFNPALSIGEDLELWLRLADHWPIVVNELHTVVVVDHEDRSINKFKNNPGLGQLASYKIIFKNNKTQKVKIKASKRKELFANALTSIGLHYLTNGQKVRAIWWLFKGIVKKPRHPQTKFRIYAVFSQIPLLSKVFKKEIVLRSLNQN